jgi:hypothetical protein
MSRLNTIHPGNFKRSPWYPWLFALLIILPAYPVVRDLLVYLVMKIYEVYVQHRSG